jgi:murein DD-endopeptidase MepM/ murein hydrolase activator NlpD
MKGYAMMQRIFWLLLCLVCTGGSFAQKVMPAGYFSAPLQGKLIVSGTFGELRPDHFHSGLDFSTQNKENLEVLSSAAGYVSRIKISASGYGKVIYITHPNGFVSVYAHLNAFNVVVDDYVKRKQYEQKTFEIELFPNPALFPVRKGDIVGYSGNTGASGGPHLHFEIRNSRTELPFNALYAGFVPADKDAPIIEKISLSSVGNNSQVNGQNKKIILPTVKNKKDSCLTVFDTIKVTGNIIFGMKAWDKSDAEGICGIYAGEMLVDSVPLIRFSFDSLSFDATRYVNALIDFETYINSGERFYQSYVATGNRSGIYSVEKNKGIFCFSDTNFHKVTFVAKDFFGNQAVQTLIVKSSKPARAVASVSKLPLYHYGLKEHFEAKNITVDFPANALYDSIYFDYKVLERTDKTYSGIHQVHLPTTPIHTHVLLKIKPDIMPGQTLAEKLCLALYAGDYYTYVKTEWADGFLYAKISSFGNYCVVADTVAPEIKPIGIYKNKKINPDDLIKFTITDNFSGISSYVLTVNGKWALAEYDAKNNLLTFKADAAILKQGVNLLDLKVSDRLKNEVVYSVELIF